MLFQVSKTHPLKDKIIADFKQNLEFLENILLRNSRFYLVILDLIKEFWFDLKNLEFLGILGLGILELPREF